LERQNCFQDNPVTSTRTSVLFLFNIAVFHYVFFFPRLPESTLLEKEAKDMEVKLQVLQERLLQQQLESEKTSKSASGTRWKSSNPQKGSIRAYGKDVSERVKTKILATQSMTLGYDTSASAYQPVDEEQPPPLPPKISSKENVVLQTARNLESKGMDQFWTINSAEAY
jgi:hypothetical protein